MESRLLKQGKKKFSLWTKKKKIIGVKNRDDSELTVAFIFCVIQFDNINANDTMSSITVRIQTEIIILKIIFGLINLLCK